jgi:hypothetical protein
LDGFIATGFLRVGKKWRDSEFGAAKRSVLGWGGGYRLGMKSEVIDDVGD